MTIFDHFNRLFGGKTEESPAEFPDTEPAPHEEAVIEPVTAISPAAAWPFPVLGTIQTTVLTNQDLVQIAEQEKLTPEEVQAQQDRLQQKDAKFAAEVRAEQGRIRGEHFQRMSINRRLEKEELKEVVMEAPEHGIEFVHVGKTTFAWRYHSLQEGFARNKRVIDISSAVCNPGDQYAKWHGSAVAAQNMLDGKYLTIRIGEDMTSPREAVQWMSLATLSEEEGVNLSGAIYNRRWADQQAAAKKEEDQKK